jgi:GNAT superfamily N-acetyltransferase
MYLTLLTNSNLIQYSQFVPEAFLHRKELLGVVCLDDEDNNAPLGVAIAEPSEDTLNIQWFYVLPEFRRIGVGSLMLQGLSEMAEAAHLGAVDVYYHSDNIDSDEEPLEKENPDIPERELYKAWNDLRENEGIDTFLLENGFVIIRQNPIKSFTLNDIISSDYVAQHNKNKDRKELKALECVSFEDISPSEEELVISQLKSQGYPDYTPFCRRDISFICKKAESVKGCMLMTDDPDEKTLTIMILLSFIPDPLCAAKLIIKAGDKVLNLFPPDYKVSFVAANDSTLKLVGTILDDTDILKTTGYTTHAVFEVNA